MMDQNVTPSKTQHKQFPVPLIPQSYGRQRAEAVPSSMSNFYLIGTEILMASSWRT